MSALLAERGHVRLTEGELIAMWNVNKPFLAGTPAMDARAGQAIIAAIEAPDYAAIEVPALAIYAIPDPRKPLPPWYDANDPALIATLEDRGTRPPHRGRQAREHRTIPARRAPGRGTGVAECHSLPDPVQPARSARRHRDLQPSSEGTLTCAGTWPPRCC
jgi:hypothetical protein